MHGTNCWVPHSVFIRLAGRKISLANVKGLIALAEGGWFLLVPHPFTLSGTEICGKKCH